MTLAGALGKDASYTRVLLHIFTTTECCLFSPMVHFLLIQTDMMTSAYQT